MNKLISEFTDILWPIPSGCDKAVLGGIVGGLATGFGPTPIDLISIPITNTSINPAKSTRQAISAGGWAINPNLKAQKALFLF